MGGCPTGPSGHLPIEMGRLLERVRKFSFPTAVRRLWNFADRPCFPTAVGKYPRSGG